MTIYTLTLISFILFLICAVTLSMSFTDSQGELIEEGKESELEATYSKYQKVVATLGTFAFLFTVVHGTIAAAKLLAGLM